MKAIHLEHLGDFRCKDIIELLKYFKESDLVHIKELKADVDAITIHPLEFLELYNNLKDVLVYYKLDYFEELDFEHIGGDCYEEFISKYSNNTKLLGVPKTLHLYIKHNGNVIEGLYNTEHYEQLLDYIKKVEK